MPRGIVTSSNRLASSSIVVSSSSLSETSFLRVLITVESYAERDVEWPIDIEGCSDAWLR